MRRNKRDVALDNVVLKAEDENPDGNLDRERMKELVEGRWEA